MVYYYIFLRGFASLHPHSAKLDNLGFYNCDFQMESQIYDQKHTIIQLYHSESADATTYTSFFIFF